MIVIRMLKPLLHNTLTKALKIDHKHLLLHYYFFSYLRHQLPLNTKQLINFCNQQNLHLHQT